ncbi:MAG: CBS domain-containing protein [Rhodoplanes sp.]|uniref:CBS domain-containing protein n=1 Tax=Rhodoplanes sp. TaxID=1968906 RepID=UPI00184AC515|nr:CBS domain-containing protein [Rhodoplanes sp.]NVO13066.1 CBS domain-containing protein [Rhodoplanes sp.]
MRRLLDLRQPAVHTISADAPLADAAHLMATHAVAAVVVLGVADPERDRPVGVLAERSFAAAAARHPDRAPRDLRVRDAMTATTVHATLDTTVPDALALLQDRLDHLPVTADGQVVDLLSRSDLLAELVWHHAEVIREMRLQEHIMHLQGVYSC